MIFIIPSISFFFWIRKIQSGKETPVQTVTVGIFSKGTEASESLRALLFPHSSASSTGYPFSSDNRNGSFPAPPVRPIIIIFYSFQTCLFKIAGSKISVSLYFNSYQFSPVFSSTESGTFSCMAFSIFSFNMVFTLSNSSR